MNKIIAAAILVSSITACSDAIEQASPSRVYDYCRNWDAHVDDNKLSDMVVCIMDTTDGITVGEGYLRSCFYSVYNVDRMTYEEEIEAYYYLTFCALPEIGYEVVPSGGRSHENTNRYDVIN